MIQIFVDRKSALERFRYMLADDNPVWLLNITGGRGIGKTTLLKKLITLCPKNHHLMPLNFALFEFTNDPFVILNKLAAHFPNQAYQAYQTLLVEAYQAVVPWQRDPSLSPHYPALSLQYPFTIRLLELLLEVIDGQFGR